MRARGVCAVTLAALGLAACAGSPTVVPAAQKAATGSAGAGGVSVDPSYDWHVLVRAPFGTSLKAIPFPLHEVLVFHDTGREAADVRDCYGIDDAAPHFLAAAADEYVLCFEHDRLARIDASVLLPTAGAAAIFARACALWREHAAPDASPPAADTCEGRDHGVAFGARLASGADEPAGRVSMTLTDAADR